MYLFTDPFDLKDGMCPTWFVSDFFYRVVITQGNKTYCSFAEKSLASITESAIAFSSISLMFSKYSALQFVLC